MVWRYVLIFHVCSSAFHALVSLFLCFISISSLNVMKEKAVEAISEICRSSSEFLRFHQRTSIKQVLNESCWLHADFCSSPVGSTLHHNSALTFDLTCACDNRSGPQNTPPLCSFAFSSPPFPLFLLPALRWTISTSKPGGPHKAARD